jgi:tRNA (cmo5U34)-methyltransferase
MNEQNHFDALFSGVIGEDYDLLKLICPLAAEMSRLVGETVGRHQHSGDTLEVVELGGGTGITTLAILSAPVNAHVVSIDNEPTMQNQAKQNLKAWHDEGKVQFCAQDALSALQQMAADSADVVASAYTLHNFFNLYREEVISEIFRVLKPGGLLVNGDRYALDDITEQTRQTQQEIDSYFNALIPINRPDLLKDWIIHLFGDESENRIMRQSYALLQLHEAGFVDIDLSHRMGVNALVTAAKPG